MYIEHTDCFGVVFNANYWRFLSTAREAALSELETGAGRGRGRELETGAGGLRHSAVSLERGRLSSPARLGDVLTVTSQLVGRGERCLLWRQTVLPAGGGKPHASCDVLSCFLDGNGAAAPLPAQLAALALPPALDWAATALQPYGSTTLLSAVDVSEDELGGAAWGRQCATEADVLRWFERGRTDAIGGGSGLAALQAAGVLVVVTSVEGYRAGPAICQVQRGGKVTVRSACIVKRRGLFLFQQEALWQGEIFARAEVMCACIDASSMSLTAVPPELAARLAAAPNSL